MPRLEPFQLGGDDPHRRERDCQLGQREPLERTARHSEQLERGREVRDGLGANRFVGDQLRGELGDLCERFADLGGVGACESGGDAGGAQRPGGVFGNTRQCLGKFQCL
ncbi:MAG: hypothetical protein ABR537_03470 [Gemmatimonadales bacterium]